MSNTRDKDLTRIYSYGLDEAARADSVANGTRQINPLDAHGQFRNANAPRGGLSFDQIANTGVYATLTNQTIGADPCSVVVVFKVPTANPPNGAAGIFGLSLATFDVQNSANRFECRMDTSGNLVVRQGAGVVATVANFVTNYAGKRVVLAIVRPSNSGVITIYVNGVSLTYTGAGVISETLVTTYFTVGTVATTFTPGSTFYSATLYNFALSAADVLEIMELGGGVPNQHQWGYQIGVNSSFNNPSGVSGNSTTGFTAASVADGTRVVATISNTSKLPVNFRGTFNATITAGSILLRPIRSFDSGRLATNFAVAAGANVFSFTWDSTLSPDATPLFEFFNTGVSSYVISSFAFAKLGAVCHLPLDDGLGFQLRDVSPNLLHAIMSTAGINHIIPRYGPARIRGTTNTNGNQQLLGTTCVPRYSQILKIRARSQTGTPTITIGDSSGGSQFVASVALSTTWKDLTIALANGAIYTAGNSNIWIGSNSTDVVEIDITWEPVSP